MAARRYMSCGSTPSNCAAASAAALPPLKLVHLPSKKKLPVEIKNIHKSTQPKEILVPCPCGQPAPPSNRVPLDSAGRKLCRSVFKVAELLGQWRNSTLDHLRWGWGSLVFGLQCQACFVRVFRQLKK